MATPDKKSRGFITGKLYFQNKEFKMAEKCILEYLANKPDDISALMLLAQIYENLKNYLKAFTMYEQCYQLNPERSGILLEICRILMMSEVHFEDVDYRKWLNLAIRAHPSNPIVQNLKAFLSTCPYNAQKHTTVEATPKKLGNESSVSDQLKELIKCINQVNIKIDKMDEKIEDLATKMKQMSEAKVEIPVQSMSAPGIWTQQAQSITVTQEPAQIRGAYKEPVAAPEELAKPTFVPQKPAILATIVPAQPLFKPFSLTSIANTITSTTTTPTTTPSMTSSLLSSLPPPIFSAIPQPTNLFSSSLTNSAAIPPVVSQQSYLQPSSLFSSSITNSPAILQSSNLFSSNTANSQATPQATNLFPSTTANPPTTPPSTNLFSSGTANPPTTPQSTNLFSSATANPPATPPSTNLFSSTTANSTGIPPVVPQQTNFFSSSLAKNQIQPQWSLGQSQFNFSGKFEPVFSSSNFSFTKEAENSEDAGNDEQAGDDVPIVSDPSKPLPPVIDVKTGEEDEDVIFENRAKIYRMRDKEYKERGVGVLKLLHNSKTKFSRLLMRRELTNLVCLNSPINTLKGLEKPRENTLQFSSFDYSDSNEPTPEVFLVRMKPALIDAFETAMKKMLDQSAEEESSVSSDEVELVNPILVPELVEKARSLKLPDLFYHDIIYRDESVFNGHDEDDED